MTSQSFRLVPLDTAYGRTEFNSGSEPLDRYLKEQVTQDVRRRIAACFVALETFSASRATIPWHRRACCWPIFLPRRPKNCRYPTVPAVRMGRLAVDQAFKGRGLGGALLADALARAASSEIAAYALMVDAKDKTAEAFYRHHGFIALPDSTLTLFLPLATAVISRG